MIFFPAYPTCNTEILIKDINSEKKRGKVIGNSECKTLGKNRGKKAKKKGGGRMGQGEVQY